MPESPIQLSVFTKPWPGLSLPELARFVRDLGFDGIELPVRPGFQVAPDNAADGLAEAEAVFDDHGLRIFSVAAETTPAAIRALGRMKRPPLLRVMADVRPGETYTAAEERHLAQFRSLLPLLEETGVCIGVQNHDGPFVANACGIRRLVEEFDRRHIGSVWDIGHCALAGELPEHAADILWPSLKMVNWKNAVHVVEESDGPGEEVRWTRHWCAGREGLANWRRAGETLLTRDFEGIVCLTAEYTRKDDLAGSVARDLELAVSILRPNPAEGRIATRPANAQGRC